MGRGRFILAGLAIGAAVCVTACGGGSSSTSTNGASSSIPAFTAADLNSNPAESWPTNGGALNNQRYSTLDSINRDNVNNLRGVWKVDLQSGKGTKYSAETQPIYYNGMLYIATGADDVSAIDVDTGEVKWTYSANLDQKISTVCCGWSTRGVAIGDGRVYIGQLDATLVALDASTGNVDWTATVGDWKNGETITAAPLYYNGKVYSGISGGEFGIRGRLTAFDAGSGKELWKFYTVPTSDQANGDTWPSDKVATNGGAPIWQTPSVDPDLNTLYFSTGNVSPDFDGSGRAGDNLYGSSVIALNADTGEYKWHYQMVHHDIWDYDFPTPTVLLNVTIDGAEHKAVAGMGKTGWVYLLDRESGKPVLPITETKVAQDAAQHTSPTQPIPQGDSFVPQSIAPAEAQRLKAADPSAKWTYTNGGKIFTPFHGQGGVIAKPATLGGTNWPPSSYNPDSHLMFICASDTVSVFTSTEVQYNPGRIEKGTSFLGSAFSAPKDVKMNGTVTAMDMTTNRIAWQNKLTGENCYSGTVATAGGLVFVGRNNGELTALNSGTGKQLWSFQTGAGANSTATVLEKDGQEYIAFYAGGNSLGGTPHGDNFWLFSLNGEMGPAPKPGPLGEAPSADGMSTTNDAQGTDGSADKPETGVGNPKTGTTNTQ